MIPATQETFSFLDHQLAQLLVRLCADCGVILTDSQRNHLELLARYSSQATRQGVVATPLPAAVPASEWAALQELPVVGQAGEYKPLIIEHGHIWLNRYWQYEHQLACNLAARLHQRIEVETPADTLSQTLNQWFPDSETALQKQAIERAAHTPFLIISGGPGTGKTTTVTRLLCLLVGELGVNPDRILLAAPTGKAAMRMQEAIRQAKTSLNLATKLAERIPEQGKTLHRLLGYIPGKVGFRHHAHNPLPADVVIVDEASMIDISLMAHLFAAVRPDARLILLGDKDQLASVETGSVFRDMCAQDNQAHPLDAHLIVLEKSWRFTAGGGIGLLAAAVRDRQGTRMQTLLEEPADGIHWTETARLELEYLEQVWGDYLAAVHAWQHDTTSLPNLFAAFNAFRLLSPLRKGPLGTEQLNQHISKLLARSLPNPSVSGQSSGQWYAGRPVMVTENDYRQNLFNGDIGITLPSSDGVLRVWFAESGGFRPIATVRLPAHETAWAMTIHKSQGSEFGRVLLVLPDNEDAQILGRELLYTGITRARHRLDIMGRQAVLQAALQRSLPDTSCIRWRLREAYKPAITSNP